MSLIRVCDISNKRNAYQIKLYGDWIEEPSDPDGGYFPCEEVDLSPEYMQKILNELAKTDVSRQIKEIIKKFKEKNKND